MSNEQFIQEIIADKGLDQAIWFCEVVSRLNGEKYKEIKQNTNLDPVDYAEFDYERHWWEKKAEELKNTKA